jgi:hypothetical protein
VVVIGWCRIGGVALEKFTFALLLVVETNKGRKVSPHFFRPFFSCP